MSNNFLSNLNFEMVLTRLKETSFMLQSVALPGINSNPVMRANPFVTTPLPGDHAEFSPLTVQFAVDDKLENYMEIYEWMIALYFPDNHLQYKKLSDQVPGVPGIYSDLTLQTLSGKKNPLSKITFYDAFPVSLSELSFTYQTPDVEYISCSASFYYRKFEFST